MLELLLLENIFFALELPDIILPIAFKSILQVSSQQESLSVTSAHVFSETVF
jgi:hypothetical protein